MPFDDATYSKRNFTPFSLGSLISWLETQDPAKMYVYAEPYYCLIAQYTQGMGGTITDRGLYVIGGAVCPIVLPWRLADAVTPPMGERYGTYGAALERARALVAAGYDPDDGDTGRGTVALVREKVV